MEFPSFEDKLNVLVTDDHPFFRKGLVSVLESFPFIQKVEEASNGEEAVQKIGRGKFHLVFMDIEMPVMNGKDAIVIIRKENTDVKLIAISIIEDIYSIRQMYLSGCDGYLIKNANENVMLNAIVTVMRGEKFFTKEVTQKLALESDSESMHRIQQKFDFTPSEKKIIALLKLYKSNKEIAAELFISVRTVENHRYNIYKKIGVTSTAEFVRFALKHKL